MTVTSFSFALNPQNKRIGFRYIMILLCLPCFLFSCRKSDYTLVNEEVVSDYGGGTGTITWKADKKYILDGLVFVNDGQILTIEPGTVIQARTGQGELSSALVVARGGNIIAEGKSDNPIIFTVEGDDLHGSVPLETSGLWGGLIILGNATVNNTNGESFVEGIPISEPRGIYGGQNDDDNSGILRYISIRHGGTNIGEGNEINGLTLGGVGRKTIIDHIEVVSNRDDGIEVFGGTVNCRNLAVAFCGDDAFDFDEGYSGKLQFLLGIHSPSGGDLIAEHNGSPFPEPGYPFSHPEIYNASYFGLINKSGRYLIKFDSNSGGVYRNSLFLNSEKGVGIEFSDDGSSYHMWMNKNLELSNNIFKDVSGNNPDSVFSLFPFDPALSNEQAALSSYFPSAGNEIKDPGISGSGLIYDPLPLSSVFDHMGEYSSDWFEIVSYKGAFGSNNWLKGWSYLWNEGIVR